MIDGPNECTNAALIHSEVAQVILGLAFAKIDQLTLDLGTDHNRFSREVTLRVIPNRVHVLRSAVAAVAGRRICNDARSARTSSVLITSMSRIGSIVPLT